VPYTSASAADDIVEDFGTWANYASNASGSTFEPDTVVIAPKLYSKLTNRRYGDNADKSVWEWMISNNPHIKNVVKARELNDAGGTGIHAMAFFRRGAGAADSSLEIVKPMTTTLLPPHRQAMNTELWLVSAFGGLNQREAGDNLVVYVQGE